MKTAISLPDDVFREGERYAHKTGKTRSQLYGEALRHYLLQHTPDAITEAMNRTCDELNQAEGHFVTLAAKRMLKKESW
jgi:metal-responsive CopG/Arc/MetJ family transcriptional regulator